MFLGLGLVPQALHAQPLAAEISATRPGQIEIRLPPSPGQWLHIESSHDLHTWKITEGPVPHLPKVTLTTASKPFGFFRIRTRSELRPAYTVAVIGDSTASGVIREGTVVSGGWAEGLKAFTGPDTRILNAAEPGLSTKNALGERRARLAIIERTRPAFVLIQFGQIDQFSKPEENKSTTLSEFQDNLETMVSIIRSWNGTPILVTPLPWRVFRPDGSISTTLRDRSDAMLELSDRLGIYAIDFHAILSAFYLSILPSERHTLSAVDQYHFSEKGAVVGAERLIQAFPPHLRSLLFETEQ